MTTADGAWMEKEDRFIFLPLAARVADARRRGKIPDDKPYADERNEHFPRRKRYGHGCLLCRLPKKRLIIGNVDRKRRFMPFSR